MDPEEDLLDRYDRMVQTQLEILNGIDEKAATTMRLVSILLGLLLAGAAVVVDLNSAVSRTRNPVAGLWIGIGMLWFLVSLTIALLTYVSSRVLHGPREELGEILTEYTVTETDYSTHLLLGYTRAIRYNRAIIRRNSRWFRHSLQALLFAMLSVSIGVVFVLVSVPLVIAALLSGLVISIAAYVGLVVFDETYLVPNGEW